MTTGGIEYLYDTIEYAQRLEAEQAEENDRRCYKIRSFQFRTLFPVKHVKSTKLNVPFLLNRYRSLRASHV